MGVGYTSIIAELWRLRQEECANVRRTFLQSKTLAQETNTEREETKTEHNKKKKNIFN